MKKHIVMFLAIFAALFAIQMAFSGDVPGVTVADFESPEAAAIWSILAGQGPWGVLLFAILGVVWKFGKPYLETWAASRKLDKLLLAVEAGVGGTAAVYVEEIKAHSADGKLTESEAQAAREKCKEFIIGFMKSQGIDVVKDYGHAVLDYLIEYVLAKLKINNALTRAVAAPLSASAPLPPSV